MYNQQDFARALETAGFRRDGSVWSPNATFMTRGPVVVSLYPWYFVASLTKPGRDGARVVDHTSGTDSAVLLGKTRGWGVE